MALKHEDRIAGAVHDVAALSELPDDDCNVLLVSSRTLYMLANIAEKEATWHARFAKTVYTGGLVNTVESDDPEADFVDQVIRNFRLEVIPVTCDLVEVLDGIRLALTAISQQVPCGCESVGTTMPQEPETGPPPIGPSEDFPDVEAYDTYKCQMATTIVYEMILSQQLLMDNNVEALAGVLVTVMAGLVSDVLVLAGLARLAAQIGVVAEIIQGIFTGEEFALANVREELEANRPEFICALFCAANTEAARTAFQAVMDTTDMTTAEKAYMNIYLYNWVLNPLFSYQPTLLNLVLASDCSGCGCSSVPCPFLFQAVSGTPLGTGTFRYDGLEFTLTAVQFPGESFYSISFSALCDQPTCSGNWCVEFISTTADTGINTFSRTLTCYQADCENVGTSEYQFATPSFPPLDTPLSVAGFSINNTGPFTVTLKITGAAGGCTTNPAEGCGE